MDDPGIRREQCIADEQLQAWKDAQLDRLWSVYADEVPWRDARPGTEASSEEETMSKRTVYRYTIPVDDQSHVIRLTGDPLHVANGATLDEVEFWAEHDDEALEYPAAFQVVGTGQPLPEGAVYAGSAPRTREGLVWHLYRLPLSSQHGEQ